MLYVLGLLAACAAEAMPCAVSSAPAAKQALDILKGHDEGFGPATAIAATRYASTLLAIGSPQEAQVRERHTSARGA